MKEKKAHSFAIPIEMKQKSTCIGGDVYHFNWDCFFIYTSTEFQRCDYGIALLLITAAEGCWIIKTNRFLLRHPFVDPCRVQ